MLLRLTVKNTMNRARDYAAYLIACVSAIVVYFCFTSIETDPVLTHLRTAGERWAFGGTMGFARIVLLLFTIFFLSYANLFFLKKRKQEIGVLSMVGVTKAQISLLFFGESLLIGVIAMVIGILLGILLSKLFAMLLLRMMGIAVAMPFLLSWQAIGKTSITFGLLFLITGLLNSTLIFRYQLVDLLHPARVSAKMKQPNFWTYLWGLLGLSLIIGGYYLAESLFKWLPVIEKNYGYGSDFIYLLLILLAEIIGTLAFFQAYIQIWLQLEKRWKRLYYRGTHLLSVSNLSYRFRKNAKTLWMITILSAVTITTIGSTAMFYTYSQDQLKQSVPASLVYTALQKKAVTQIMQRHQIVPKSQMVTDYKVINGQFKLNSQLDRRGYRQKGALTVIKLSDYNRAMVQQFQKPMINLQDNEAIAVINTPLTTIKMPRKKELRPFKELGIKLNLQQPGLRDLEIIKVRKLFPNGPAVYFQNNLVVITDQQYQKIQADVVDQVYAVDLSQTAQKNKGFMDELIKFATQNQQQATLVIHEQKQQAPTYSLQYGQSQQKDFRRSEIMIQKPRQEIVKASFGFYMYVTILIALIFMLATGSIIMLKQLSEAQEEIFQYKTLKKIGMSAVEIKHTIYFQILMIFLLPIILGTLHAVFAIRLLSLFLDNPGLQLVYIVCGIFIMIYFMFYLITAKIYNRIVNQPLNQDARY